MNPRDLKFQKHKNTFWTFYKKTSTALEEGGAGFQSTLSFLYLHIMNIELTFFQYEARNNLQKESLFPFNKMQVRTLYTVSYLQSSCASIKNNKKYH